MDIALLILAMVVMLLTLGFFSGSEIALVNVDRMKLRHLAAQGDKSARLVLKLLQKPEVLLGTTLVGTNLALITLTTLGTILMLRAFDEHGDLLAFLIYTPLFLILGEVVPKSVYQQKADTIALRVIHPLHLFSWLFYPVVFVFSWVARQVARLAGVEIASRELFLNREQLRAVVDMAEQGADIDVFDRDRILRVTSFAEATVGKVMIPLAEMTTLSREKTSREAVQRAHEQGHFRLPVFEEQQSQIVGVISLTMWDLMDPDLPRRPLEDLIQPAHFVTINQLLDELLPVLQSRRDHMAIVVDEFESAIGMVTLEDVLEEVVGEVVNVGYTFEGHLPRQKYDIAEVADGAYLMDGRVSINEVNLALDITLEVRDAHTVGGMMMSFLRHIPAEGEYVEEGGYRFTVEQSSERGVGKIRAERVN